MRPFWYEELLREIAKDQLWRLPSALPGAFGYLYLPALAIIALASVMSAPIGARTAHRVDVKKLKRLFAVLLLGLASTMLYRAFA